MNIETVVPVTVVAHVGPPPSPANLASSWTFDPVLLITLALATFLYYRGFMRLWERRRTNPAARRWQAECFAAALAVTLVALISPLDALSSALFSAHMVQHLLLIAIAAPLFVLAFPAAPFLVGLPHAWRRVVLRWSRRERLQRFSRFSTRPQVAFIVATSTLWLWHLPPLYELALRNQFVHAFEHVLLLSTALLFWLSVSPVDLRRPARSTGHLLAGVAFLAAMAIQGTVLGIAIAFSSQPWYPTYALTSRLWGLNPVTDQQIAGLIMWIPAGAIYIAAALFLLGFAIARPYEVSDSVDGLSRRSRILDVVEG
jgi:putative membrane protein